MCVLNNKNFIFIVGDVINFVKLAPFFYLPLTLDLHHITLFVINLMNGLENLIGFEWILQ